MFGEAVKRLDQLAPNLVQICGFVWEWTWAKYNSPPPPIPPPPNTTGVIRGGGGSVTHSKVLGSCQTTGLIGATWYTSADSSGNGHRLNTIRPSISHGAFGGGELGFHQFKSMLKLSNGWTDWHQLWFTSADSSGNGHRLKTSRPTIPQEEWGGGGLEGHKFKCLGKLSNCSTDCYQIV